MASTIAPIGNCNNCAYFIGLKTGLQIIYAYKLNSFTIADVRKEGLRRHYLIANEGTRGTFKIQPGKKQKRERYNLPIGRYIVIAVPAIQRITNKQGQDAGDVIGAGPWTEKKAAIIAQLILGKAPVTALAGVADEH